MSNCQIVVTSSAPNACSLAEISAFKEMVIEGAEVNPNTIDELVERALILTFAHANAKLVGVGAVKRPNDRHRAEVFSMANSQLNATRFELELGWFYVNPTFRGNHVASKLMERLASLFKGRAMYATSRTNNDRMHALLRRHGFVPEGSSYASKMNNGKIQLLIRH